MTTCVEMCGCDEAKHWQARAIRAEADLAIAKNCLRTVATKIGAAIDVLPPEESSQIAAMGDTIIGFTESGSVVVR